MKRYASLFAIALVLATGCKTAEFGPASVDINGMVYDFSNRPVPDYKVYIGERETVTDVSGRFSLRKVPVGKYSVIGAKKGYESYSGETSITGKGQIVYVRIPSEKQLLDLVDSSLANNDIPKAASYVTRAANTGAVTNECKFYSAVVLFRQCKYREAGIILEDLIESGWDDSYVRSFYEDVSTMRGEE